MGETVEQTVHREVNEEVGLRVKNLRYYKSQPWPDSSSLLCGFFCELDGSPEIVLDKHELSVAEWVDRDQLLLDNDHSLTRDMMGVLRDHRENDYSVIPG
jgi:NAD+ diphosphatase